MIGIIFVAIFVIQNINNENITHSECNIAEFRCNNNQCVPLDRFCNNIQDCLDSSDEPRYCSPCNRTYFGETGRTYSLEIHRPNENKVPFICHLTFNANGSKFGDIIQITFESFTLGKLSSFQQSGCTDGYLQINESDRPQLGGSWCGVIWNPVIYFSETKSVTLSIYLINVPTDQSGFNFDFKIEYKLLMKENATVRFGNVSDKTHYLGDLISGTYCSRIYTDCDKRTCYLQSPNFPGIYPRNLTCYYAIRQNNVPNGKHAMISIAQPNSQLISIRGNSDVNSALQQENIFKVWDQCDSIFDFVTIYDGYTTRDPVILKFCGGGEPVPETISSGHELLVEFTTSPYGTFSQSSSSQSLHGFELEVQVKYVDENAPSFVRNKRMCEFWIRGIDRGILENPKHSLIPNTTCLYHLQGINFGPQPLQQKQSDTTSNSVGEQQPWRTSGTSSFPPQRYRVWISIIKFHVASLFHSEHHEHAPCTSYLSIWDGYLSTTTNCNDFYCQQSEKNVTLLAKYCKEHLPRSCDHFLLRNNSRYPRPCSMTESYLSSSDSLTLELKLSESTSLRPVSFYALYEFVDFHLDGEPYDQHNLCSRKFSKKSSIFLSDKFQSPKNVFLFGRGGSKNIHCIYRFETDPDERIQLTLNTIIIKNHQCTTYFESSINRYQCHGQKNASLSIQELSQEQNFISIFTRDCFCGFSNQSLMPFTLISTSHIIELKFTVQNMSSMDDFNSFYFQGTWKFIKSPICRENRILTGSSGEIKLVYSLVQTNNDKCQNSPWLIIPSQNKYLYIKMNGVIISDKNETYRDKCRTKNRLILSTKGNKQLIICPEVAAEETDRLVEVFSNGWTSENDIFFENPIQRALTVEFIGRESGSYSLTWIELSKRKIYPAIEMIQNYEDCFKCPEFDACINISVICDGIEHCPSGFDESLNYCSLLFQLPISYLIIGFLFLFLLLLLSIVISWKVCVDDDTDNYEKESKKRLGMSFSSDDLTVINNENDIIC